jgi:hypothetical protein
MIIDQSDSDCAEQIAAMGIAVISAQTVMNSMTDKIELAGLAINFASKIDTQNKCDENVDTVTG